MLEFMLASDEASECAERALEWLALHAGVTDAMCLALDEEMTRLAYLTGRGPGRRRWEGFGLDVEDRDHPLVQTLFDVRPRVARLHGSPTPCTAVPLFGFQDKQLMPAGVLLVWPAYGDHREVRWMAEFLGYKLRRLRWSHGLTYAERRLQRERAMLYGIIDSVSDPILLTDAEGRMVVANERAKALLATREDESEGRRRAVALNNLLFSSALGKTAVSGPDASPRELLLVDPSEGSDLLFELLSTQAGDPREGTGVVSILRNVTDLRRAGRELEENYRRLRMAEAETRTERDRLALIIDSVADPIVVTDPSGNIVLMNEPAERLFTAPGDAAPEITLRVQANDANFTSFVSNVFFGTADARYRGGISLVDPRTGTPVPVEALSVKVQGERGEVTAVVTILHDRTEALERERLVEALKQASSELEGRVREATSEVVRRNELLQRQALQLEQASSLKSQFLANMSHELRTPLNAILGYTSVLLRGISGELTAEQRQPVVRLEANGRHLLGLINDILDISRIEAGKMTVTLGEVAVDELVREVMAEVEPLIERSRLVVTAEVPERLPALRSDRQKIKQILLNLLTNALKFTPQGSVQVSATYLRPARSVLVAVADTGVGIAPADQERIFEDFSQVMPVAKGGFTGAGLGLSISRRLAAILGGRIALESKVGQGSTFSLVLPLRPKGAG